MSGVGEAVLGHKTKKAESSGDTETKIYCKCILV